LRKQIHLFANRRNSRLALRMKVLTGIFSQLFLTLRLSESKLVANDYKTWEIGNKKISYDVSRYQRACSRPLSHRATSTKSENPAPRSPRRRSLPLRRLTSP
jgi:hypothetical protein